MGQKSKFIHLNILQVDNPGHFWAIEAPGAGMSSEAEEFKKLNDEMNEYYSENYNYNRFTTAPHEGLVCIAQRPADKKWYRVRIEKLIRMMKGPHWRCKLLDYGGFEEIPQDKLRRALPNFTDVPYQAKLYGLHGVQPVTLVTSIEDMTTTLQPCVEWDVSATRFMERVIEEATDIHSLSMGYDDSGKRELIRIYMEHEEGDCLNELLITKKYAVVNSYGGGDAPCNGYVTAAGGLDQVTKVQTGISGHIRNVEETYGQISLASPSQCNGLIQDQLPPSEQSADLVSHSNPKEERLGATSVGKLQLSSDIQSHMLGISPSGFSGRGRDSVEGRTSLIESANDEDVGQTLMKLLSGNNNIVGGASTQTLAARKFSSGMQPISDGECPRMPLGRGAALAQVQKNMCEKVGSSKSSTCMQTTDKHLDENHTAASPNPATSNDSVDVVRPKNVLHGDSDKTQTDNTVTRNDIARKIANLRPGGRGAALLRVCSPLPGIPISPPEKVLPQQPTSDHSDVDDRTDKTATAGHHAKTSGNTTLESRGVHQSSESQKPQSQPTFHGTKPPLKPRGGMAMLFERAFKIPPDQVSHQINPVMMADNLTDVEIIHDNIHMNDRSDFSGSDGDVPSRQIGTNHSHHVKSPINHMKHGMIGHAHHVSSPSHRGNSHQPHGHLHVTSGISHSCGRGLHHYTGFASHSMSAHKHHSHHGNIVRQPGHHVPHGRMNHLPHGRMGPISASHRMAHTATSTSQVSTFTPPPGPRFTIGRSSPTSKSKEESEAALSIGNEICKQPKAGAECASNLPAVDCLHSPSPSPSPRSTPGCRDGILESSTHAIQDMKSQKESGKRPNSPAMGRGKLPVSGPSDKPAPVLGRAVSPSQNEHPDVATKTSLEEMSATPAVGRGRVPVTGLLNDPPPVPYRSPSPIVHSPLHVASSAPTGKESANSAVGRGRVPNAGPSSPPTLISHRSPSPSVHIPACVTSRVDVEKTSPAPAIGRARMLVGELSNRPKPHNSSPCVASELSMENMSALPIVGRGCSLAPCISDVSQSCANEKNISPDVLEKNDPSACHTTTNAIISADKLRSLAPKGRAAALLAFKKTPCVSDTEHSHNQSRPITKENSCIPTDERFSDAEPVQHTLPASTQSFASSLPSPNSSTAVLKTLGHPKPKPVQSKPTSDSEVSSPHEVDRILSGTDSGSEGGSRLLCGKIKGRLPKHAQRILDQQAPGGNYNPSDNVMKDIPCSLTSAPTASPSMLSTSLSPEKTFDHDSNSRFVGVTQHQKLLVQHDKMKQTLDELEKSLKGDASSASSPAMSESPIPQRGKQVQFSDNTEILRPETVPKPSPPKPILKKLASDDVGVICESATMEESHDQKPKSIVSDDESEFQRLDLKGFTSIRGTVPKPSPPKPILKKLASDDVGVICESATMEESHDQKPKSIVSDDESEFQRLDLKGFTSIRGTVPKPSPPKPILKKLASDDVGVICESATMEESHDQKPKSIVSDDESEFQRLDLKGFTSIRGLSKLIGSDDKRADAVKKDMGVLEPYLQEPALDVCDPLDVGLLIEGKRLPRPILSVSETNLNEDFKEILGMLGVMTPTHMQSYAWPVIQRGLSMVGIAPIGPGRPEAVTEDRCATYLLPLLSSMMMPGAYTALPVAPGPVALVLCSSWRRAQWVYDRCLQFVIGLKLIKPLVLFGCNESQDISLINGCDILMATPASLLRALKKNVIHLNRLCHLVLDDGDVLVEDFRHLVKEIMSLYAHELKLRSMTITDSVPRQIILMGSQWTKGMQEFRKYMTDSILIINSKLDAAVYCGMEWVVHVWHHLEHLSRLIQFLDHVTLPQAKVVIFTKDVSEVHSIHQALQSYSHHVLLAHERMEPCEVNEVRNLWKKDHADDSQPILVLTDDVMSEFSINDAVWLIHYSLPETKSAFYDRLWFASKHLQKKDVKCSSVVIVTDRFVKQTPTIVRILNQANVAVPEKLKQCAMGSLEGREEGKFAPLCTVMKAFGYCRNASKGCGDRHVISDELDMPGKARDFVKLPKRGEVTVLVMHVVDAGHFFVRLLETREGQDKVADMKLEYERLVLSLHRHMSVEDNRESCYCPFVGDLYAFEDTQHTWHRVSILTLGKDENSGKVQVEFVDRGDTAVVNMSELKVLPREFVNTPFQAVEVFICQVKPLDEDLEWTQRANAFIAEKIHNKELDGKVVLCLGNTLWLHPLRQKVFFKEINSTSYDNALHDELLQNTLAVKNDKHMDLLYAACHGKIELPEILAVDTIPDIGYNMYGMPTSYCTETLLTDGTEMTARVCTVDDPGLFFMHVADAEKRMNELHQDIRDHLKMSSRPTEQNRDLRIGSLVLARLPSEEQDEYIQWYRGKILDVEDDKYDVFYLDFGDRELVGPHSVQPLSVTLLHNPMLQAMECCLAFVDPIGEGWTIEDGDILLSMVHDAEERSLPLSTKVITTSDSRFAGSKKYCVQLFDKSNGFPLDLGQELVIRGVARPNQQLVEEQFNVKDDEEGISEDVRKVTSLCASILMATDGGKVHCALEELTKIVTDLLNVADCANDDIRITIFLHHITCLIGYSADSATIVTLASLMLSCSEHLLNGICGAIDMQVIIAFLRLLLRNVKEDRILDTVTSILATLAEYAVLCPDLLYHRILYHFANILDQTSSIGSQINIMVALASLVTDALSEPSLISKSGCISSLCKLLERSDDVSVHLGILKVFSILAPHERWNEQIRKDGGVMTLCQKVQHIKDQEGQEVMLDVLVSLAENCVFTREAMASQGHQNFHRLLAGCLSDNARELCQALVELMASVECNNEHDQEFEPMSGGMQVAAQLFAVRDETGHIHVPSTSRVTNQPLPKMAKDVINERRRPQIQWMQDKWNIVLRVKVSEVVDQNPAELTENSVVFRAISEAVEYSFEFKLYELVLPSHCVTENRDSEVLIGLRKKSIGRWPRLLQPRGKVPYLSVDYDCMIDSDSESDSDCELRNGADVVGSPLGILGKHKRKPLLPLPPSDYVGKHVGIPESLAPAGESQDSPASSDNSEDDEDERRRFEYFND